MENDEVTVVLMWLLFNFFIAVASEHAFFPPRNEHVIFLLQTYFIDSDFRIQLLLRYIRFAVFW